jgi:hypothetical protein
MGGLVTGAASKATPWGAIASLGAQGLMAVVNGIRAASQQKKFNQTLRNQPQYQIPQEYQDILARNQQMYNSDMPGYAQTVSNIGQAGATARGAAERGAIGSVSYGAQVGDIYQKELDAYQNLGVQQAQYKVNMAQNVNQAQAAVGEKKDLQFDLNKYQPWQAQLNRYGEGAKSGWEGMMSAIQGGISNISDLFGTQELKKAYQQVKGQG